MTSWTVEIADDKSFGRFVKKLSPYEQAVLFAAIEYILKPLGDDICNGEWGTALGEGLYEFRIRRSLSAIYRAAGLSDDDMPADAKDPHTPLLLRVFCSFEGSRIVLVLGAYNKKKDPSSRRQQREIKAARKRLKEIIEKRKRAKGA